MKTELNTTYTVLNNTGTIRESSQALFSEPLELVSFILSILGLTANGTAILATARVPNGNSKTHSKLIINLCVSDGLVLIAIPLKYIFDMFSEIFKECKILYKPVLYIALIATQINLLAMALDHYLAIMRPLHHRQLLSNFRGCWIVIGIWAFSITAGLMEFIVGLMRAESGNNKSICTTIQIDEYDLEIFIIGFIFVLLIIIVVIYTKIYVRLKEHAMIGIPRQQTTKALVTTVLLIGSFTLSWAPIGIYQIYINVLLKTNDPYLTDHIMEFILVDKILLIVLQMNSLIDPLIYAIRLPQVRTGCQTVLTMNRYRGRLENSLPLSPM